MNNNQKASTAVLVMADTLDDLSADDLARRLEGLGLSTTGSKAVLRERLRKAMEESSAQARKVIEDYDDDGVSTVDGNNLENLSRKELKQRLRDLRLPVSGPKAVLRERLRAALQKSTSEEDESEESEGETICRSHIKNGMHDGVTGGAHGDITGGARGDATGGAHGDIIDGARGSVTGVRRDAHNDTAEGALGDPEPMTLSARGRGERHIGRGAATLSRDDRARNEVFYERPRTMLTFKDVEDALATFSGDGTQNVQRWFASFEETADLCAWTDTQKIIYAKRLLRGSAKLFANFECHAQSYRGFKRALSEAFGKALNSRQIHKELGVITKKTDETFQEYIYRVLELASHAEIELEAKIQYIIDGVKDEESNKSILYSATTIKELRQRFVQYEAQRTNRSKAKHQSQTTGKKKLTSNQRRRPVIDGATIAATRNIWVKNVHTNQKDQNVIPAASSDTSRQSVKKD